MQAYYTSYEWTFARRLRAAARATARFYAFALVAGALGISALLASGRLAPSALLGLAAAAGNLYGLFGAIVLLAYGLVDVPRSTWHEASAAWRVRNCRRQAARAAADAEKAAGELCRAVAIARATASLLPRRAAGALLRRRCDDVLAEVADAATAAHDAAPLAARGVSSDDTILGALRVRFSHSYMC